MKFNSFLKILIPSLFGLSILTMLSITFIPFQFGAIGTKIVGIIYSLCSSYVASYIFYFVLVYLKDKNDKKRKREEFRTHISIYLNKYHKQLKELLATQEDIINVNKVDQNYHLDLEALIHIFDPIEYPEFYTRHSDNETRSFLQNRTKRYRNYFFALNKLIDCIKRNHHLLDYYDDHEFYELFNVFIHLNEEDNLEEELNHRANTKHGDNLFLYEKDLEHIKEFTGRIKDEPEYAYPLELNSKEYLDLYYRFKSHLELNIIALTRYSRDVKDRD